MFIERYKKINDLLEKGKVVMIYGPRQCGKTTLVKSFLKETKLKYTFVSGEFLDVKLALGGEPRMSEIEKFGIFDLVVIDEAQMIPNIGKNLKALVDTFPDIYVIATGSSSFELSGQVGEPLVGRQRVLHLFPFWEKELVDAKFINPINFWDEALIFGKYPEVVLKQTIAEKKIALQNIINGYLFKDILAFDRLKKPEILVKLLELLAYQIGNEVSITELSEKLKVDQKTVLRYINLLEQTFVIFKLDAYAKNPRTEIQKKKKYYFYDLGIRNGVIRNFNFISDRNDFGHLFENYLLIERMKKLSYKNSWKKTFFWRTLTKVEIDYIEIEDTRISAFEFKWNENKNVEIPKSFSLNYPGATFEVVNRSNYSKFVL